MCSVLSRAQANCQWEGPTTLCHLQKLFSGTSLTFDLQVSMSCHLATFKEDLIINLLIFLIWGFS